MLTTGATEVRAGAVLATPGDGPARTDGSVTVAGGRVSSVEPSGVLLDAPSTVAVPGLANAHDHGRPVSSLAFGAIDGPLETWLPSVRRMPRFDPEAAAVCFFARLLRSGFTASMHLDRPGEPERLVESLSIVGKTASSMGVAAAIAVPMANRRQLLYTDEDSAVDALRSCGYQGDPRTLLPKRVIPVDEQLAVADEVAAAIDDDRVNVQYGPQAPQWASDDLLEAIADASARTGRRIHMHLLETARQRVWADREHPDGLIRHLDRLGLLSERLSVAHGVWLQDDELELLADRRVTVVVNTSSNLRLRSGTAPVARMLAAGVPVATGLDGLGLDDDTDGFREARLFHLTQAGTFLHDAVSLADSFRASMDHGHRVVRGSAGPWGLSDGAPADIVLLDQDRLRGDGAFDVEEAELIGARATTDHVRHVVAAGRVVVFDGQVVSADVDAAAALVRGQLVASADDLRRSGMEVAALQAAATRFYEGPD